MTPISADRLLVAPASSALVSLFTLDLSSLGGAVYRFCSDSAPSGSSYTTVSFGGVTYTPFPVELSGLSHTATGELPKPTLRLGNPSKLVTSLLLRYNDLSGAKFTRIRTFPQFLDNGSSPDPTAVIGPDIFYVERKVLETSSLVELELSLAYDMAGVSLPGRIINTNVCGFVFRGPGCGYAEGRVCAVGSSEGLPDSLGDLSPVPYLGPYSPTITYTQGQCVSTTTDHNATYNVNFSSWFKCVAVSATGRPLTDASSWTRIQRYRGNWGSPLAPLLPFSRGDVVSKTLPKGDLYYIWSFFSMFTWPNNVPPAPGWLLDVCPKSLEDCAHHFDPLGQRHPLPFGGFPGTGLV